MPSVRMALVAAFALLAATGRAPASGPVEVDLELVLAVDVSGSMDLGEHRLQRQGYVEALRHPAIWNAIESGAYQRIAVTYVEWAGAGSQRIIMPWRLIDTAEAASAFAGELETLPVSDMRGTSISGAIDFSAGLFAGSGFEGFRRVIDISGDGPNSRGRPVVLAREAALAQGLTINGLPIMLRPSFSSQTPLDIYYGDCVIGGPNAFVLPVTTPEEMEKAIRRKLVLEIALAPLAPLPKLIRAEGTPPTDCMVGERLRRMYMDP